MIEPKNVLMNYATDPALRASVLASDNAALLGVIQRVGEFLAQWGAPGNWRMQLVASLGLMLRDISGSVDESRWSLTGGVEDSIDRISRPEERENVRAMLRGNSDYEVALRVLMAKEG